MTEKNHQNNRVLNLKYEFTDEVLTRFCTTFHRIRALKDFGDIKKGDIGGWIEKEENLSHNGLCWVADEAMVFGDALVCDDAIVSGNATIAMNAIVRADARVFGNSYVMNNAIVEGCGKVYDHSNVLNGAKVDGNAEVVGHATLFGNVTIYGNAKADEHAYIAGNSFVHGNAYIGGYAELRGETDICGEAKVCGIVVVGGTTTICGNAVVQKNDDFVTFKNWWSSGRWFTWTRSNDMWKAGCFYGTGDELIKKAYQDSKVSGDNYKAIVEYVEKVVKPNEIPYPQVEKDGNKTTELPF